MKELDMMMSQVAFFVNMLWFHFVENKAKIKDKI